MNTSTCEFCGLIQDIDASVNVTVTSCKRCQGFQLWKFNRANELNIQKAQYQQWYNTEYKPKRPIVKIKPNKPKGVFVKTSIPDYDFYRWQMNSLHRHPDPGIDPPIDEPDLENYKFSNEVPANLSFEAQGSEFTNEHLDASQEGRYLREHCVQRNGANHFLHLKSLTDLRSVPQHQDPYHFSNVLDIPFDLAKQFSIALKSLEFDRKGWLKLYHGTKKDMGLKDMCQQCRLREIQKMIEISELLEQPDPYYTSVNFDTTYCKRTNKRYNDGYPGTIIWNNYIHMLVADEREFTVEYMRDLDKRVIQALLLEVDPLHSQHWEEDYVMFLPQDDNLDSKSSTNPYSTNRLYNGNDSLSWEFQRLIETADDAQLDKLRDGMKPSKRTSEEVWKLAKFFMANYNTVPSDYSSRTRWDVKKQKTVPATSTGLLWQKPKFHYFTDGMKSHFWTLYHLRRDELRNQVRPVAQLSPDAKVALEWVKSLGKGSQTCSIIHAASDGKSYSLYGMDIEFKSKLHQHEVNTLWQAYRSA